MEVLITGAAGNLGSSLARHLVNGPYHLRLLFHRRELPDDLGAAANVVACRGDLNDRASLPELCRDVDCIVHFAGTLFAPRPETFLPHTNVDYVQSLAGAALEAGVRKFILISFPHVEGESTPEHPATGRLDGQPSSVHAKTRLLAEKHLFNLCRGGKMTPVALRSGMIYGRGVLMVDAARWLLQHHLLAVWRQPTWVHLLAMPDFLSCVEAAIAGDQVSGIYNLGDDHPTTLQVFLDSAAKYWGLMKPWRFPQPSFYVAAAACEAYAMLFKTASPLTRDFIKIGMASYVSDTTRMKKGLLPRLAYPTLDDGLVLL